MAVLEQTSFDSGIQTPAQGGDSRDQRLNLVSLSENRSGQPGAEHSASPRRREANSDVLHVLQLEVDHPMGRTPEWVPREMRNPAPNVQCASTASNIYREAMLASHVIESMNSTEYRGLTQVQVPNWINAMKDAGLAEEIPRSQIRPGDVVVGMGGDGRPGNNDRHIGFVGEYNRETGRYAAYSNAMGQLRHQDLDDRFGRYRDERFYRIYFPE